MIHLEIQTSIGTSQTEIDARIAASDKISSDITQVLGSTKINNIVQCSQAEYNASTKQANTLYIIVGN